MPAQDARAKATATLGREKTSGRMLVMYRNTNGETHDAIVIGPGTGSGLKIRMHHTDQILDNVPKISNVKSTNCYIYR